MDHERLEVYQLARLMAREGNELLGSLRGARAELMDQFRRASLSVALNIAEGAGEFSPREKARFYRMAKRSATECGAVLDHIADLGFATPHQTAATKTLLRRIVGALVKLILSTARSAAPAETMPERSAARPGQAGARAEGGAEGRPPPAAPSPKPARAPKAFPGPGTGMG
jgi:four helix bundle protein